MSSNLSYSELLVLYNASLEIVAELKQELKQSEYDLDGAYAYIDKLISSLQEHDIAVPF